MRFSEKLDKMYSTIDQIRCADLSRLEQAFNSNLQRRCIAIGSGGSLATAQYFQSCRRSFNASTTEVLTPLDWIFDNADVRDTTVWIFSARGENPDAHASVNAALERGAKEIHIICSHPDTSLINHQTSDQRLTFHFLAVADPKDGFLATHSFVAAVTALFLVCDTIAEPTNNTVRAETFAAEATNCFSKEQRSIQTSANWSLSPTDTIIILCDPRFRPAATVLETSIWETALCSVQVTDFRNFAHGRHVWPAKISNQTRLLGIHASESCNLWETITELLPSDTLRLSLGYIDASRKSIALAMFRAFAYIEYFGKLTSTDPGKPGVGPYAKPLYEDKGLNRLLESMSFPVSQKHALIEQMAGPTDLHGLISAERAFRENLSRSFFNGIIFDYDGTLVSTKGRYGVPSKEIASGLNTALRNGLKIGVATGRGKSAGSDLRQIIEPQFHASVLVAYYNGAYITPLTTDITSDPPAPIEIIQKTYDFIEEQSLLLCEPDTSKWQQLLIDKKLIRSEPDFFESISTFNKVHNGALRIVESGHSIDVIPSNVHKSDIVNPLAELTRRNDCSFIRIGDSGQIGGNDFDILDHPLGVSVDRVSPSIKNCWSLFCHPLTGPQAVLAIFDALKFSENGLACLDLENL